jgi:hypothetical protein
MKLCSLISRASQFLIYFHATFTYVFVKKLLQSHATPKTNVMQFTIKTQEISKAFSLRPTTSSRQDQGFLSRYAPIKVLGCHYLRHPNGTPWSAFIAFTGHSSPWW